MCHDFDTPSFVFQPLSAFVFQPLSAFVFQPLSAFDFQPLSAALICFFLYAARSNSQSGSQCSEHADRDLQNCFPSFFLHLV